MGHRALGWSALAGLPLVLLGCGSFLDDLDLSQFTQAPAFFQFDLSRLETSRSFTYIELREGTGDYPDIVTWYGDKCSAASNPTACVSAFDSLRSSTGFGGCVDHDCAKYFVVNSVDDNYVVATQSQLLELFGPIDAPEEALIIANSHGYMWNAGKLEEGAYRAVADGYELLVTKMTSSCDPVERWRYLLHVAANGTLTVEESEEIESTDGCV